MLQDSNVGWLRKRIMYNGFDLNGLSSHTTSGRIESLLQTTTQAYHLEISTFGVGAVPLDAGERVGGLVRCPYDLDPAHEVGFKVWYTGLHDGTGDATTSWILLQDALAEGIVLATATTALDTVIPLLNPYKDDAGDTTTTTDYLLQNTTRGIRNSIGLTPTEIEAGAFLTFSLEMDAVANLTTVHWIGLEMDYTPKKMKGEGLMHPAPLTNTI